MMTNIIVMHVVQNNRRATFNRRHCGCTMNNIIQIPFSHYFESQQKKRNNIYFAFVSIEWLVKHL